MSCNAASNFRRFFVLPVVLYKPALRTHQVHDDRVVHLKGVWLVGVARVGVIID